MTDQAALAAERDELLRGLEVTLSAAKAELRHLRRQVEELRDVLRERQAVRA